MEKYHGKKITESSVFKETIPPQFINYEDKDGVYRRVRFVGNFGGILCNEFQEFERFNITHQEAKQIEWSAFGWCSHTVSVFDAEGHLIDEWK